MISRNTLLIDCRRKKNLNKINLTIIHKKMSNVLKLYKVQKKKKLRKEATFYRAQTADDCL